MCPTSSQEKRHSAPRPPARSPERERCCPRVEPGFLQAKPSLQFRVMGPGAAGSSCQQWCFGTTLATAQSCTSLGTGTETGPVYLHVAPAGCASCSDSLGLNDLLEGDRRVPQQTFCEELAADTRPGSWRIPNTQLQRGPAEDMSSASCSPSAGPTPPARAGAPADSPLTALSFLRAQHPWWVLHRQSKIAIFCLWENSAAIQKRAWDLGHLHSTSVTTHVTHGLTESLKHPGLQLPTFVKERGHSFSCPTLYPPFANPLGQRLRLIAGTGSILAAGMKPLGVLLQWGSSETVPPSSRARAGLPFPLLLATAARFPLLILHRPGVSSSWGLPECPDWGKGLSEEARDGGAVPGRRRKGTISLAGAAGMAGAQRVWWDWWPSERWGYPSAPRLLLKRRSLRDTESLQSFK